MAAKRSPWVRWLTALVAGLCFACAQAQPSLPWSSLDAEQQEILSAFAARWEQMPLEQRAQLLANAERLRKLPPEQREQLKHKLDQWQAMPADERARLRERFQAFQAMPPGEQDRLRREFERFNNLPPQERQRLRREFEQMSPEQRRAFMLGAKARQAAEVARRLFAFVPPEERQATWDMLQRLSREDRRRMRELVRRMPPWQREELRKELLATPAEGRSDYLRQRLVEAGGR